LFVLICFHVAWTIQFFLSWQFLDIGDIWRLDECEDFVEAMQTRQPQAILEGATDDCSTNPIVFTAVSSTDPSDFPNVSAVLDLVSVVVLRPISHAHWNTESIDLLQESTEVIKRCQGDPLESVNVSFTDSNPFWHVPSKPLLIFFCGSTGSRPIREYQL
jgi:hypothetical protein